MNKEKLVERLESMAGGSIELENFKYVAWETANAMKKEYDKIVGNLIIHDVDLRKRNDDFWKKWCGK